MIFRKIFRKLDTLSYLILENLSEIIISNKIKEFFSSLDEERKFYPANKKILIGAKRVVTAKDGDKIVGIAGINRYNGLFIIVKKEFQRSGIGTKLMEKLLKNFNEPIILAVHAENKPAIRLYRKFGFKETERTIHMALHYAEESKQGSSTNLET